MRLGLLLGVVLLLGCPNGNLPDAGLKQPAWVHVVTSDGPSARSGHHMVYDSFRRRVILFGGYSRATNTMLDDTWSWDGSRWVDLQPAHHPPARAGAAMVFDAARDRIVLFGGEPPASAVPIGDTWEFDGTDWTEVYPAAIPPARESSAYAWDAKRHRTVIFGGGNAFGLVSDTWEYDGTTWREVPDAGGPPSPGYPIATFDGRTERIAMLSDEVVNYQNVAHLWEFDGAAWSEVPMAVLPECPGQTVLGFHARYGLVQYGCIGRDGWLWSFDGSAPFRAVVTPAPPAVNSQGLAYDADRQRLVLFGGNGSDWNQRDETWELK